MRKIQASAAVFNKYDVCAIGDSFTLNYSLGMCPHEFYPTHLQTLLRGLGALVQARNYGVSGNTSAQMLTRVACMTQFGVPKLAIIYAGVNDIAKNATVASGASTTQFTLQTGQGAAMVNTGGPNSDINGTNIIVNGTLANGVVTGGTKAVIASITGDVVVVTAPLGFTPSAGMNVAIDTQANLTAIGNSVKNAGCANVVFLGQHYINTTGGTVDTHSTPRADYAALRTLQQAAATAVGAVYCNVWSYIDALIQAATPVTYSGTTYTIAQGDGQLHVNDGTGTNGHLSALGEYVVALAVNASVQAQSGWLAALGS